MVSGVVIAAREKEIPSTAVTPRSLRLRLGVRLAWVHTLNPTENRHVERNLSSSSVLNESVQGLSP